MEKQTRDYHAKLVIYGLPTYNKSQVKRLVQWLEHTTKLIKRESKEDPKMYAKIATWKLMK